MPTKRAVLIALVASTVIWLIVLIPSIGNNLELSFTTDDSGLLVTFQWLRVLGMFLLPFTIFLSVVGMWLLYGVRLYRGAVIAAILPLFSLLIYFIGAAGVTALGA